MTESGHLTGFDRIQLDMAFRYAQRRDGWPVGPQYLGRAWSCATPTVQIIRQPAVAGLKRYRVLTLFPFLHTDRRHRPSRLMTLVQARTYAWRRLRERGGSAIIVRGVGHGIELARCGDYLGLEERR